jgi:Ca-activated chloride channel family protein
MTFAWPHLLWLLILPLALLGWDWLRGNRAQRNAGHEKILRAEAGASRLSLDASNKHAARRRYPRFWLAIGLCLSVLALARPQWGRIEEQVFEQSREILIALDLSR